MTTTRSRSSRVSGVRGVGPLASLRCARGGAPTSGASIRRFSNTKVSTPTAIPSPAAANPSDQSTFSAGVPHRNGPTAAPRLMPT